MYCKEAWMDMQNRIPSLRDMDMAYQLDRMKPQGKMTFKEKEMEPKFKVGDKVVTPKGKWGEVIAVGLFVTVKLRESRLSTGTFNLTTHNELWKHSQLRLVNIYDEAGKRWRSACAMKRLTGWMTEPYTVSPATLSIHDMDTIPPWDRRLTEEEKQNETESELRIGDIVENRIGERGRVVKISKRVFVYVKMITGARESRTLCFDKKGLVKLASKEKEMGPKFKVGDIVKTELHELGQVSAFFEKHNNVRVHILKGVREGKTLIFDAAYLSKVELKNATAAYIQEGYKAPEDNICHSALRIGAMEKAVREAYQKPPQPIFRLKHNNGSSGWEGCHFVLVAEDEQELLVKEVDINEAKVRDRVMTLQKSNWTRDYSIGDEIINFLSARGGNFTNKLVDKS